MPLCLYLGFVLVFVSYLRLSLSHCGTLPRLCLVLIGVLPLCLPPVSHIVMLIFVRVLSCLVVVVDAAFTIPLFPSLCLNSNPAPKP